MNMWDVMFDKDSEVAECTHCNGYGSSFKDPVGVNRCSSCSGSGVMPKADRPYVCEDCGGTYAKNEIRNYKYEPKIILCDSCHDERMKE
jgi:DnaJ-class molecular chaperone